MMSRRMSLRTRFARSLGFICIFASSLAVADRFEPARDEVREVMHQQNVPSIAVSVAHQEKIVWEEAFGYADAEQRIPALTHTPYSLASILKPVTATALVLVERGVVDLDKPIDDCLGKQELTEQVDDAQQATVHGVARHARHLSVK